MAFLLENPSILNGTNLVGRLTYGLIGLDLKLKKKEEASEYLNACTSIYNDLKIESAHSQLMSLFDYEEPAKLSLLSKNFEKLKPLLESAESTGNKSSILLAKDKIKEILNELDDISGNRESNE